MPVISPNYSLSLYPTTKTTFSKKTPFICCNFSSSTPNLFPSAAQRKEASRPFSITSYHLSIRQAVTWTGIFFSPPLGSGFRTSFHPCEDLLLAHSHQSPLVPPVLLFGMGICSAPESWTLSFTYSFVRGFPLTSGRCSFLSPFREQCWLRWKWLLVVFYTRPGRETFESPGRTPPQMCRRVEDFPGGFPFVILLLFPSSVNGEV